MLGVVMKASFEIGLSGRRRYRARGLAVLILCGSALGWGCVEDRIVPGDGPVEMTCVSSLDEPGTIEQVCSTDDAFCEPAADGLYCTGHRPFVCPEGMVRIDWINCGFPPGEGGAGGLGGARGIGGEGGQGGGAAGSR
jgi:hypothetical protein